MMRTISCAVLVLIGGATAAAAQPAAPLPLVAADLRGSLARFKQDPAVAQNVTIRPEDLPTRGLGLAAGVHIYPLRLRGMTIGLGGEWLAAGDTRTPAAARDAVPPSAVTTRMSALGPQISFNFGRAEGWSYISGGIGSARMTTERENAPQADVGRTRMLNYGGGARWFNTPHLAFTFDVRFYAISPREAVGTVAGYPRVRFMVLSAGVSFK